MKIYKNKSDDHVINKNIEKVYDINILMKSGVDHVHPIIILNDVDYPELVDCNYCYISHFDRFYFIRAINRLNTREVELTLECDVLETYKEEILNSRLHIKKQLVNEYHSDSLRHKDVQTVEIFSSDIELEPNRDHVIITTLGGASLG